MAEFIYTCSALVSIACCLLIFRSYARNKARLLLWIGMSFVFLALNSAFVYVDLILLPHLDLWGPIVRNALFALAGTVLVVGLAWELS
jgi:hypothetical protein